MATLVGNPWFDPLVIADLREGDWLSCGALGFHPLDIIRKSVELSEEFFTIFDGTTPIAVWGYRRKTFLGDTGSIWMMTGHAVESCKVSFAKESKRIVAAMLERFSVLECAVHFEYQRSINWLGWLGFIPEEANGPFQIMRCYRGMN